MADLDATLAEGFRSLVDEVPELGTGDERAAWALGYLYSLAAAACPTAVRVVRDGVLGAVFEVDQADGRKVGFVVVAQGRHVVPVRVYER